MPRIHREEVCNDTPFERIRNGIKTVKKHRVAECTACRLGERYGAEVSELLTNINEHIDVAAQDFAFALMNNGDKLPPKELCRALGI